MYLIIDKDIPFINEVFEPYAKVYYCAGGEFAEPLLECGREEVVLVVRTRTKCTSSLLSGANVRLIASATIGLDHIDLSYCNTHSICVSNARGCNSKAVMQYFFTSLAYSGHLPENRQERSKLTIGVIGAGNIGEKVAVLADRMGFNVLRNDPPKAELQKQKLRAGTMLEADAQTYYSLEEVLENSDIVTLHTPLNNSTINLANKRFFSLIKPGAVLVNSSRGEVVEDSNLLSSSRLGDFICDVWQHEPAISQQMLLRSVVATPHIAGYSEEGKRNATDAVIRAVAEFMDIAELKDFTCSAGQTTHRLDLNAPLNPQLLSFFPIGDLDSELREQPENFEIIRKHYKYRNEFDY